MLPVLVLAAIPTLAPLPQTGVTRPEPPIILASTSVRCSIRSEMTASGVRLNAVITAGGTVSGTYRLQIQPTTGGEPLAKEDGVFESKDAALSDVKTLSVDLPPGQGYSAALSVEWPNGSSSCSASSS